MEQSSIGILISSQTHIVYSNLAFQSMFNIQKEINDDFSINELINVIVDEDKPLFYSFLNPVLLHDLVYRVQSSNNNERWVLHLPKYIKYDQKSVIFSQFIDISSFKERETALIENFANLNAILEASSDLLWVLDKNLHVTFMNINTAAVLYKIFKQDFKLGSSFIDKIPIEIQGIWRSRFEQTLNGDSLLITEEYGKLDQKVFYEFCFNPVINSNKEIIGATVLGRDITEFKNFILKLKDSNVERSIQLTNTIEHLQKEIKERRKIEETLIEAKDLAEAANRAKTEFLANMSHELRTPLNAILGFSQLLIDQNSSQNPDEKEFLTNINESGKHLLTLINDILDLSIIYSKLGLAQGARLESFVEQTIATKKIEDTKIPFYPIATDLNTGETVILEKGSLAKAIRASSAIPGIFVPVTFGNRLLIDGGVTNNIPCDIARQKGADIVIAVNISKYIREYEINSLIDIIGQSVNIGMHELSKTKLKYADVVIEPDTKGVSMFDFSQKKRLMEEGIRATKNTIPRIKLLIEQFK